MNQGRSNTIRTIGILVCVIGIIVFVIGASTGSVTGYRGANGLYYSDPGATSSNEWMCIPGLIMAVGGGLTAKIFKS